MSLTARERHNPPPRRKSCAACIKAKRRCDAGLPACARCLQRGIACELPPRKERRGVAGAASPVSPAQTPSSILPDLLSVLGPLDSTGTPCDALDDQFIDPRDPMFSGLDAENLVAEPVEPSFPFVPESMGDSPPGMIHIPLTVAAPNAKGFDYVPDSVWRKLGYAVRHLQQVPSMMVLENQTPWSHPKLYEAEMPRLMQDAHACCALYMSKNRINAPIVLRTVGSKAEELIAAPEPTTASECLAHTQSLLLYHIIRIFDGDIEARAAAERTQSALEDSAMALIAHTNFDLAVHHPQAELSLYPLTHTRAFWLEWIFQESARRTLLFTFFLLQAYRVLAGLPITPCDGRLGMTHAFTMSAPLWHAGSAVEFAKAWSETRHLFVSNGSLDTVVREAKPHHVDVFGRILMTTILGEDEVEGWFASKGGSLYGAAQDDSTAVQGC